MNRKIQVAIVRVESRKGHLWQSSMEYLDGRVVDRNYLGISETLKPGEKFLDAAIRGLREELGINVRPRTLKGKEGDCWRSSRLSRCTGEWTEYTFQSYDLWIGNRAAEKVPLRVKEEKGWLTLEWRRGEPGYNITI